MGGAKHFRAFWAYFPGGTKHFSAPRRGARNIFENPYGGARNIFRKKKSFGSSPRDLKRQFTRTFVGQYSVTYARSVQYTVNFDRSRPGPQYTGNFSRGQFTGQFTMRIRKGNPTCKCGSGVAQLCHDARSESYAIFDRYVFWSICM